MENSKESELSIKEIVDRVFCRLIGLTHEIDVFTRDDSTYVVEIADRRSQAVVCHELLDYIYDHGYAFTKQEADIIIKAKKKLYPTLYDKSEPVVGS